MSELREVLENTAFHMFERGKILLCMVMRLIFRHMVEVRMQSVCTQNLRKPNTEQEGLYAGISCPALNAV